MRDVVAITGEHDLRVSPTPTAPRIRNNTASSALGIEIFHVVDQSTTVRRLCVQTGWTEVQIESPEWLTDVRGWVPNTALRAIDVSENGNRIYVAEDFYWDDDTEPFKSQIVSVVNRIARENRDCGQIDPSSVAKSPSRSTADNPVFFVTCNSGTQAFNVWFSATDADRDGSFVAKEPIQKGAAVDACEVAARLAAAQPSTVRFSRVLDLAYVIYPAGRARVVSTFTARNSLNLELKFRIDCLFDGSVLIETRIAQG